MKKQILLTAIFGFSFVFAGALFAQEKNDFTISITKNGEKIVDTSFTVEGEMGLSSALFKVGGLFMPEIGNKEDFTWAQGDSMHVVVLADGKQVKMLRKLDGEGDSIVKEIIIKEGSPNIFFSEDVDVSGENIFVQKKGNKKIVWVTEEDEEGESGKTTKKIIIRSAGEKGSGNEQEHSYSFSTEGEGSIVVEYNGEEGKELHKEIKVTRLNEGNSNYSYVLKLKTDAGKSVFLGSMSEKKIAASDIHSTEDFSPLNLRLEAQKDDLKFDLSFSSENKSKLKVNLYNEKGKELSEDISKNAKKFKGVVELPSNGKYFLKLSSDGFSRLFELKVK